MEILKATLGSVAYGDPQRPDVLMGPVISAKQRERVLGYIEKGVAEGATLALGGGRPADLPKGWFVEPTLFTDVDNSMTIAQEEIFGPVLVVIPYDDDDDAVRIANDSVYGLSGGVFSGSLERALGVAERIRTGTLLRQRRHADRAGRHALRRLQAQRHRPPERARRLRPVSRDRSRWPGRPPSSPQPRVGWCSDERPRLGPPRARLSRAAGQGRRGGDQRRQLLRARGADGAGRDLPLPPGSVLHLPCAHRRGGTAALVLDVQRAGDRRRR